MKPIYNGKYKVLDEDIELFLRGQWFPLWESLGFEVDRTSLE